MILAEGADVAEFLGRGDDANLVALAEQHVGIVAAMARAYTRGAGFDVDGNPADDLAAVIVVATARLLGNPEQAKAETIGPFSTTYTPFVGWSLAETFVLNRYRRRAA